MFELCSLGTALAVAALLVAERRGTRAGVLLAKPLASTGFVAAALAAGALGSGYGRLLLAALVLSWLGDLLLLSRGRGTGFRLGLVAFLVAHLAFATAFLARGVEATAAAVASVLVAVPALVTLCWLAPHLRGGLRGAVPAYLVAIAAMLVTALASILQPNDVLVAVGALSFAASDLFVARERFVATGFLNQAWGLPLYYAAQLLLASTV